jgi:hypothetical protein
MTDNPVGQFSDPSTSNSGAKLMTCGYLGSAVTHTLATSKGPMHFKWRAPVDSAADTHFYLTTVRSDMSDWYVFDHQQRPTLLHYHTVFITTDDYHPYHNLSYPSINASSLI